MQKAKAFYADILGLEVKDNPMGLLELKIEGCNNITIYHKPNRVSAIFTIMVSFVICHSKGSYLSNPKIFINP